MSMVDEYIRKRILKKKYPDKTDNSSVFTKHLNIEGWTDIAIGSSMIFSHRNTNYTKENFEEGLHVHQYYELLIYVEGNVEYINESIILRPYTLTTIWFKPGQMHTARLVESSKYERYVFYFNKDFFKVENKNTPILDFMENKDGFAISHHGNKAKELLTVLTKAENTLSMNEPFAELLLRAYLIEIFGIIDSQKSHVKSGDEHNETIAKVKQYIDTEYATITSITDIADKFFYSREHLSRKFHESFNISISSYITKRRILESLPLLQKSNIADAAYTVGYKSQSAFIASFKKNMGILPSEYKKINQNRRCRIIRIF